MSGLLTAAAVATAIVAIAIGSYLVANATTTLMSGWLL